jgi:hypothetical protein
MSKFALSVAFAVAGFLCASCGDSSPSPANSKSDATSSAETQPAPPADYQSAAENVLGDEAEILAFGDLAKTGNPQVLAVNKLTGTPPASVPGTLITRLAVIEMSNGKWKELLRCDEHLKNTRGYLGGTPLAAVPAWRLQYNQDAEKGLVMYFTPLTQPAGGYIQTIGVEWNRKTGRYQSLDRSFEQFVGETEQLETPQSVLR